MDIESFTSDDIGEHQAAMAEDLPPPAPTVADEAPSAVQYASNDYAFEPVQGIQDMPMPDGSPAPAGRLFFVDFLPQCKGEGDKRKKIHPRFDEFATVFAHINNWIQAHGQYRVISVEQFCRKVDWTGRVLNQDTIYTSKELHSGNWIRGTRIWLVPKPPDDLATADSLGYINAMPVAGSVRDPEDFLDLKSTASLLNEKLKAQPVPGRIVAVLTVEHAIDSDWKPSQAVGSESGDDLYYMYEEPRRTLTILRVIYAHGVPCPQEIGIMDFPPRAIKLPSSGSGRPYMQPLRDVLSEMYTWIAENDEKTIRVVNVQVAEAKFLNVVPYLQKMTKQKSSYDTGSTWYQSSTSSDTAVIRVPRVFYVKLAGPSGNPPRCLTTKFIVTPRVGYTDGEMMTKVVGRANAWLSLTGNEIAGVQTTTFGFDAPGNRVDIEESCRIESQKLAYYIEVVALFLQGSYVEPDPSLLPPTGQKIKAVDGTLKTKEYANKSSTCAIL